MNKSASTLLATLLWLALALAGLSLVNGRPSEAGYRHNGGTSVAAALVRQKRETAASSANGTSSGKKHNRVKQRVFEIECLAAHNKWRRIHSAKDLQFDKKIAAFAQKRADFIAASDGVEFKHPPDLPYGENLAWHSRETQTCDELIKMWYDEVDLYDFVKAPFSHETGHFTQLVWRSTERVGCAKAISKGPKGGVYLVCNYDPPGNFLGEGQENVLRAAKTPTASKPKAKVAEAPATTTAATTTTTVATTTTFVRPSTSQQRSIKPTAGSATAVPAADVTSTENSSSSVTTTTSSAPSADNKKKDESNPKRKKGNKSKKKKKKNKKKKKKNQNGGQSTATTPAPTTMTITPTTSRQSG